MRRTVCLLAVVLLVVPSLGSDEPKDYDGETDRYELEGSWIAITIQLDDGTRLPETSRFTFRRGKTVYQGDGPVVHGAYLADTNCKPHRLDMRYETSDSMVIQRCIFQLEGDTLKIAGKMKRSERPEAFDDKGVVILTLKREKK
jgi:uncharacterized protein (TIGR03067 family)